MEIRALWFIAMVQYCKVPKKVFIIVSKESFSFGTTQFAKFVDVHGEVGTMHLNAFSL